MSRQFIMSIAECREKHCPSHSNSRSTKKKQEPYDNPYEETEQRLVADILDEQGLDWFHVPNGGGRWKGEGGKLKAQGAKKGVPDIVIMQNPKAKGFEHHPGVVIELKRVKGGVVSEEQKEWLQIFKRQGFSTHVCKGHMEVVEVLQKLKLLDNNVLLRVLS